MYIQWKYHIYVYTMVFSWRGGWEVAIEANFGGGTPDRHQHQSLRLQR